MGNSASTASAQEEAISSGVSLSTRLQGAILDDFNAKVHAEWMQRNKHVKEQEAANSEVAKAHQEFMDKANAVQSQLDEKMDQLSAVFHDKVVAADYDASALQEKYVKAGVSASFSIYYLFDCMHNAGCISRTLTRALTFN
jgi:hypothetical protein